MCQEKSVFTVERVYPLELGKPQHKALAATVKCGRCGKTIRVPEDNGFSHRREVETCLRNDGWKLTRVYGWVCKRCHRRIENGRRSARRRRT